MYQDPDAHGHQDPDAHVHPEDSEKQMPERTPSELAGGKTAVSIHESCLDHPWYPASQRNARPSSQVDETCIAALLSVVGVGA